MRSKDVVVILWKQNDFGLYGRRVDMLARFLLLLEDGPEVHVVEPPMDAKNIAKNLDEPLDTQKPYIAKLALEKCEVSAQSSLIRFLRNIYYRDVSEYDAEISRMENYLKLRKDSGARIAVVAYPFLNHLDRVRPLISLADRLIVDFVDDNRDWFNRHSSIRERITAQYQDLANTSNVNVTNNRNLAARIRKLCHCDLEVIKNEYMPIEHKESQELDEKYRRFSLLSGPIVAYIGNIENKLDLIGLKKLFKACPDTNFALIGSNHNNLPIGYLTKYKNVYFFGPVPEAEIGMWMSKIDVGLIPHKFTKQTRAMDPMKLSFYGSFGVPVLAFSNKLNLNKTTGMVTFSSTTLGRRKAVKKLIALGRGQVFANKGNMANLMKHILSFDSY